MILTGFTVTLTRPRTVHTYLEVDGRGRVARLYSDHTGLDLGGWSEVILANLWEGALVTITKL